LPATHRLFAQAIPIARSMGYVACGLLYVIAFLTKPLPAGPFYFFLVASPLYCLAAWLVTRRRVTWGSMHLGHIVLTLDVWGPLYVWAFSGFGHAGWSVILLVIINAQQAPLGAARVLWTTHTLLFAQLFIALRWGQGAEHLGLQVLTVYIMNLWLSMGTRAPTEWRRRAHTALKMAQSALKQANEQAEELAAARSKAETANAAKSEFLAHISHELRTPLNAVIGMSELLFHSRLSVEQRDQVDTLRSSADALLALIEDVLDYSKIEANRLELERHPFSLRQCIELSIDLVAVRAAQKDIDLAYFIEMDVPETVIGDPLRLRQVLTNLLMNAVKFTETGGVGVLVSADVAPNGRLLLHVFVNDTGIGIPADKIDRLFKAFSQVDSSTTRQYGGTGLGLAICKRLVQRMGGDIWVDSEEGFGSTFHFTVVLESEPGSERPQDTWLEGTTVMIVDDGVDISHLLSKHIRSWHGSLIVASSLSELAGYVATEPNIHVALVDLQMPEAHSVTELLNNASIPHIAMTWRGQTGLASRGEHAIIFKPVKYGALRDALQRTLSGIPQIDETPVLVPPVLEERVRVLLVDDNLVNQKVGIGTLKRLGFAAHAASNGLEAVEMTRRHAYELVLMDIFMPVMDGIVATQHIIKERGEKPWPRVVAMTANALESDRQRCKAVGMDEFLTKPLRIEALEQTLSRILNAPPSATSAAPADPRRDLAPQNEASKEASVKDGQNVLDESSLETLRELDAASGGGVFHEIVVTYLNDTRARVEELRSALGSQQTALARRLAHTIKGSSGYLGARHLSLLAAEIEALVESGDYVAASAHFDQLTSSWKEVEPQLERLCGKAA
jgi:signal transduction histidine kinase/CheY-like chemotaxis protein/HPt (histidine-containing phosphotransfer) domain-containing protein